MNWLVYGSRSKVRTCIASSRSRGLRLFAFNWISGADSFHCLRHFHSASADWSHSGLAAGLEALADQKKTTGEAVGIWGRLKGLAFGCVSLGDDCRRALKTEDSFASRRRSPTRLFGTLSLLRLRILGSFHLEFYISQTKKWKTTPLQRKPLPAVVRFLLIASGQSLLPSAFWWVSWCCGW